MPIPKKSSKKRPRPPSGQERARIDAEAALRRAVARETRIQRLSRQLERSALRTDVALLVLLEKLKPTPAGAAARRQTATEVVQ